MLKIFTNYSPQGAAPQPTRPPAYWDDGYYTSEKNRTYVVSTRSFPLADQERLVQALRDHFEGLMTATIQKHYSYILAVQYIRRPSTNRLISPYIDPCFDYKILDVHKRPIATCSTCCRRVGPSLTTFATQELSRWVVRRSPVAGRRPLRGLVGPWQVPNETPFKYGRIALKGRARSGGVPHSLGGRTVHRRVYRGKGPWVESFARDSKSSAKGPPFDCALLAKLLPTRSAQSASRALGRAGRSLSVLSV